MSELLEIERMFAELADKLEELVELHSNDHQAIERIQTAQQGAKSGADIAARAAAAMRQS
jgi:hypothetical protein